MKSLSKPHFCIPDLHVLFQDILAFFVHIFLYMYKNIPKRAVKCTDTGIPPAENQSFLFLKKLG